MATDDGMVESDEYRDWIDRYGEEEPRQNKESARHIAQQPQERHCKKDHQDLSVSYPWMRKCPDCKVPLR